MSKDKKVQQPPRWADRFLVFYCNPTLLEQIQGDVHELFYYRIKENGTARAKRAFIIDVIRFLRWRNIRGGKPTYYHNNAIAMFKNYLKIGWRNLIKQKGTSSINIFGLSIAIACCLVAYLLVESVWLKGMYHENKEDIYLITHSTEENNEIIRSGLVSSPIAELASQELPLVKRASRVNINSYVITHKNESFSERTLFVDPAFMDMFTYKMKAGYGGALNEPSSVILTHSTAQKFFGDTHPIGQEIGIIIKGEKKPFIVGGVMEDLPATALFNFEILVNNQSIFSATEQLPLASQWKDYNSWVFVQLEESANPADAQPALENIVAKQHTIVATNPYMSLQLLPYNSLVKEAKNIENGPVNYGGMGPQILLISIALFMLTLAIFNYINISILMASRRLKEIGIRKVIGGRKSQLVFQFLSENLIICLLALVLGTLIAATLFLPWFNGMAGDNLALDLFNNGYLWLFLGSLLIFVTLISGIYPAFYISSFKPVAIFAGKLRIGSKGKLTGALLTFQFVLAIITIVAGIAFLQTNSTNASRDWGYNRQGKIVVNIPTEKDYTTLRNEFMQESAIIDVAGSQDMIGHGLDEVLINYKNEGFEVDILRGDAKYPEMMGLRLKEGRFFKHDVSTDTKTSIIVNQTFMNQLGLQFPVEESITLDSIKYQIIGVVEDFHSHFFTFSIDPMVIMETAEKNFNYLTVAIAPGTEKKMAERVRAIWHQNIKNGLYQGELQSAVFDDYYEDLNGVSNMLIFTSILAIILSAMGLFGIVSLNINARMKDISIRKIMGASIGQLAQNIFKRYLLLWAIACVLGSALAGMIINLMLDTLFAFHSGTSALTIILAITILLAVITLTVGSQVLKVIRSNPTETLKME
ncbi:MAG: putative ABC transport system permease protein [Marivirga sp.]|jgi:putative ABC transport system permease protein